MAHAAKIGQLTDDLVQSIITTRKDDFQLDKSNGEAIARLRNTNHPRTNQFEVKAKLEGLVEKFSLLNRDDLSEALQTRLDELPSDSKWMPEILSLLLHLSDRPVEKTRLESLEGLTLQNETDSQALTWADIVADDPLNEDGIWDDIERGYHSSDDDLTAEGDGDTEDTSSTTATSVDHEGALALAKSYIIHPDSNLLNDTRAMALRDREDSEPATTSELFLVRETLLMLHGLPTTTYQINEATGQVLPRGKPKLATVTSIVLGELMRHFADVGSSLNIVRHWTRQNQATQYIQSCQSAVQRLLRQFSSQLAIIEQRHLSTSKSVVVTVAGLRGEIEDYSRPLICLSKITKTTLDDSQSSPFKLLDNIYEEICISQLSNDAAVIGDLIEVFAVSVTAYLRPIFNWIKAGIVDSGNDTSLVVELEPACDNSRIWHDRFAVQRLPDGQPFAPVFMQKFADRVFAVGKSHAFLRALCMDPGQKTVGADLTHPWLTLFDDNSDPSDMMPFSQLLEMRLESWLNQSASDYTSSLTDKLLNSCGLLDTVAVLDHVFCSSDGAQFQLFADALYWRMDRAPSTWNSTFLIGELVQATLGAVIGTASRTLTVRMSDEQVNESESSIRKLESMNLEIALAWPMQNITRCPNLPTYSKTFALLLEIYRAKCLLREQQFDIRKLCSSASQPPQQLPLMVCLRQHLTNVVDVLHDHVTGACRSANSSLREDLKFAESIDAMVSVWSTHCKRLETSLLLSPKLQPLRRVITDLLELCEQFASLWNRSMESVHSSGGPGDGQDDSVSFNVSTIQAQLEKALSFVVAGLRGISRAGGNIALELLAQRLDQLPRSG